jgi:hypothetical protein
MLGDVGFGSVPATSAIWVLGLGLVAALLATLSIITRKNSRHPLLLVGLVASGIQFLAWQWLQRSVAEQALASAQASAIVGGVTAATPPLVRPGLGLYLGLPAAIVIAAFGLTIVFRQVTTPYAPVEDDDA